MTNRTDPASNWARRVVTLRAEVAKGRGAPSTALTEDALSMCEALIRELAGAQLMTDRLRADLRAAEAAWDALFDTMPSACLVTDSTSAILQANRAASVLLNISATHLKGLDSSPITGAISRSSTATDSKPHHASAIERRPTC